MWWIFCVFFFFFSARRWRMIQTVIRSSRYITSRISTPSICFARSASMTPCRCLPNWAQVQPPRLPADTWFLPVQDTFVRQNQTEWPQPFGAIFILSCNTWLLLTESVDRLDLLKVNILLCRQQSEVIRPDKHHSLYSHDVFKNCRLKTGDLVMIHSANVLSFSFSGTD